MTNRLVRLRTAAKPVSSYPSQVKSLPAVVTGLRSVIVMVRPDPASRS